MTRTVQIDESRFPLVTFRFVDDLQDAEFDEYLRALDRLAARTSAERVRNGLLFDTRGVGRVSANVRRKMQEWIRDNQEISRQNCAGFAFVIDSGLVRGVLTAILWFASMPAPHTVVATVTEGEAWLTARLAEHGVRVSTDRFSWRPPAPDQRLRP